MTGVIVDASALAAVLFDEPEAAAVLQRLRGHALHAPTLIDYELASTALKKVRREPTHRLAVVAALNAARRLSIRRARPNALEVFALAGATNLTAYDASYLWLSRRLGLPIVTLDRALAEAADAL